MYKLSIVCLALVFLSCVPSLYYDLYLKYPWFDVVQHLSGAFFVAMFMTVYLEENIRGGSRMKNLIVITGATILMGVLWEFSEYIANQTLIDYFYEKFRLRVYFMGDLNDTVKDLVMDVSGAVLFYCLHLFWSRKTHEIKGEFQNNGGGLAQ